MTIPIVITAATAISSIRDLSIIKNFCHKVISFGNSNSYVLHFFQQRVSHFSKEYLTMQIQKTKGVCLLFCNYILVTFVP